MPRWRSASIPGVDRALIEAERPDAVILAGSTPYRAGWKARAAMIRPPICWRAVQARRAGGDCRLAL